jgi:hypothetical protein
MNRTLLSLAALILAGGAATGANTFTVIPGGGCAAGGSPDGRYVVGYNSYYNINNTYMESFLYDMDSQEVEWITSYDEADLSVGGQFSDISNNGVICGVAKDMDHLITWVDYVMMEEFSGPTNVASIWVDGIRTSLPYGEINPDEFTYLEDGTFALAISADGKTVSGFSSSGNMAVIKPCVWTLGENGEWSLELLPIPTGATNVNIYKMSSDGKTILGGMYVNDAPKSVYWRDGVCNIIDGPAPANPDEWINVQPLAISGNGRYVAMSYNSKGLIYDTESGEYRDVPTFEDMNMIATQGVIDNNGNLYSTYQGYPVSHAFIYLYKENRTLDLDYYLSVAAPALFEESSFNSQYLFVNVSDNGKRFSGNTSFMFGSAWVMECDAENIVIPSTPEFTYGFSRSLNTATLRWERTGEDVEGYTLKSYNVYRGNSVVAEVAADKDSYELTLEEQPAGYLSYTLEAVYEGADGKQLKSPMSNAIQVALAADYSLPFFDDFESGSYQTTSWTPTRDYGHVLDCGWSNFYGAGVNDGTGLYSPVSHQEPYSFSIVTRAMDATGEKYVSVSFGFIFALLNSPVQVLDKDYIALEISTDCGDNWKQLANWSLAEMSAGNWSFKSLDVTDEAAGKVFYLRLRRHGEGKAQYISAIDNFAVNIADTMEAPEGLIGVLNADKSATMIWKSASGAYNLNHLGNLRTMNMSFGNEGREMIGANLFTPADLTAYTGKYITSVSALINFWTWSEEVLGVHATAVIFEDGEIVREQEFGDIIYNAYNVVDLDEPLLIDGTKEIKVGVRIHDYDADQWPLVCGVGDDYVPGKTDIYSEDNGKTWKRVSDNYDPEDIMGHCLWDITAHVTESPEAVEVELSSLPLFYNIFRNGEVANTVAIDGNSTHFTDREAAEGNTYTVKAYSIDGSASGFSNLFTLISTSVNEITDSALRFSYDFAAGVISIDGVDDAAKVMLQVVAADGRTVRRADGGSISVAGLPAGVYVVTANHPEGKLTRKISVK